ncbi:MAG: dihydrofolate reductase [Pseudomonadota bacterium]
MKIAIIVAVANNRVIGANNEIPWHCPADLQYFKRTTMGAPIIMGRKTWQSLGIKPLPGRQNIVVTRDPEFSDSRCTVVNSIEQGLSEVSDQDKVFIMGGEQIYRQTLARADELYITEVNLSVEGDRSFPEISDDVWQLASEESYKADNKNPYDLKFKVFKKR